MTQTAPALHILPMPRTAAALLLTSLLCLPQAALALTIAFAGVVSDVVDSSGRLDGSVLNGTPVSGRYIVDPTPSGGPFGEIGAGRFVFTVGSYEFDREQDPHAIELLDDTGPPIAPVDIWQTREIVAPQLAPTLSQQAGTVGYGAALQLIDNTATNLTGTEPQVFVVNDLADWTLGRLTLNALVDDLSGGTMIGDLQIQVDLQTWNVVPEPGSAWLVAIGLGALAGRRRHAIRLG